MATLNTTWLHKWQENVGKDNILKTIGKYFTANVLFEIGGKGYLLSIKNGNIDNIEEEYQLLFQWQFALRASSEAWEKFVSTYPPPKYNDIWAMVRHQKMTIEGDTMILWQNLRAFARMLELMRMA